jgi:diaminohydroxyphosphoribosylaminopyrimidine deaminase/5-amino-6-(5-phosphoribosylamino)uracil reductase
LIDAGVARVVVAMEDPNPLVAGRGLARLRDSNIDVAVGLFSEEARSLNRGFVTRMICGRPYVWLKSAASLDGKVAMADGESKWITGPGARRDVQLIRGRCQAIVTGIDTVLADDPQLTVRHNELGLVVPEGLSARQPLRVILDTQGRLPTSNRLLDAEGSILWVTGGQHQHPMCANGRIEQWVAPLCDGRIDLKALLFELGRRQINEVLFEAGATLLGSLIEDRLVDQGVLYYAPKLLGQTARSLYDIAPAQLADAAEITIQSICEVDGDLRLDWTLGTRT